MRRGLNTNTNPCFAVKRNLSSTAYHTYFSILLKVADSMGILDYVSELCDFDWHSPGERRRLKKLKRRQLQTVEIRVKMDCEGCKRRVRKSVQGMKGVTQVDVEPKKHKLTVTGYVEPEKVLHRVMHRTGKKAEMWPYVPYDVVDHPYVPGVYDKKAPAGYVRNAYNMRDPQIASLARASSTEVKYTTAFSDDNPNACIVM